MASPVSVPAAPPQLVNLSGPAVSPALSPAISLATSPAAGPASSPAAGPASSPATSPVASPIAVPSPAATAAALFSAGAAPAPSSEPLAPAPSPEVAAASLAADEAAAAYGNWSVSCAVPAWYDPVVPAVLWSMTDPQNGSVESINVAWAGSGAALARVAVWDVSPPVGPIAGGTNITIQVRVGEGNCKHEKDHKSRNTENIRTLFAVA